MIPISTISNIFPSEEISVRFIFDLDSTGKVFVTPFFKSNAVILFPTGESRMSLSSAVKIMFPELYNIPHKLENFIVIFYFYFIV